MKNLVEISKGNFCQIFAIAKKHDIDIHNKYKGSVYSSERG